MSGGERVSWPWTALGLSGPAALPEIRRAYAQKLKTTHPEEDPEGFQRLHQAYLTACRQARRAARPALEPEADPRPEPEFGAGFSAREDDQLFSEEETEAEAEETEAGTESGDGGGHREEPESGTGRFADWDYERLFAEGAAEEQAARRRRAEALREKNRARYAAQEREQRRSAQDEEELWAAVMAAAHALELLYVHGAPRSQWRQFLDSPVFRSVKANLDFVFALEDFLEQHEDLPQAVRQDLYLAYGFDQGVLRPEYQRLQRLLSVSPRIARQMRWRASPLWNAWARRNRTQRAALVVGVTMLAAMFSVSLWSLTSGIRGAVGGLFAPKPTWEETLCGWMEEDFGRPFLHPDPEQRNLFAPAEDPDLLFFAVEDGKRDTQAGSPGYRTNYADRMVMAAMQDFAGKEGLTLEFDSANGGFRERPGETPGAYLVQLPLTGAEESVTQLGKRLTALRRQDWYQQQAPDFEVFLCYGTMNFYHVRSTEGDFDGDYARTLYENKFGPEICRYITERSGLAAETLGEDAYVLLERGQVLLDGDPFFWVTGLEKPPGDQILAHYYLSADGTVLFAVPADMPPEGLTQAELFQGQRSAVTLEELGTHASVNVWSRFSP